MKTAGIILIFAGIFLFTTSPIYADTWNWLGSDDSYWSNDLNWINEFGASGQPISGDSVRIGSWDILPGSVVYNVPAGSEQYINDFHLDYGMAFDQLPETVLTAGSEVIGETVLGEFTQSGGENNVGNEFILGNYAGSTGYYDLIGTGSLTVAGVVGGDAIIGSEGTGYFNQDGGSVSIGKNLVLGSVAGSLGYYNLIDGVLTVNTDTDRAETFIGSSGEGYFYQSGGVFSAANSAFYLGENASGVGTYTMDGGILNAGGLALGEWGGEGYFVQNGGMVNVIDKIQLGRQEESYGEYDFNSGSVSSGGLDIGINGEGVFNQSPGTTNTVTGDVVLGADSGSGIGRYNMYGVESNGGILSVNNLVVNANSFITANVQDKVVVNGNFTNKSESLYDWQTRNAQLVFKQESPDSIHEVMFNSQDLGPLESAYNNNFAWGHVDFGNGQFTLIAQDDGRLGALYTGTIGGIDVSGGILNYFSGDNNIYYLAQYNAWLEGKSYDFSNGAGQLIPVGGVVPEPISSALFLLGAGALGSRGLLRKRREA